LARSGKYKRWLLFFLMGIIGVLLLLFVFLNLPFSQRYATGHVNRVLARSQVPIHLDAIRKILPGSVSIQGISLYGPGGDTIIYTGELQARIRLLSLARSKVVLKELELDAALVELAREPDAQRINIAEAFRKERGEAPPDTEKSPTKWQISIRKGKLTNIHFRMDDSTSGIHISQDASEIELGNFNIFLHERDISCRSLFLGDARGAVNLAPRMGPPGRKKGQPWNLGLRKLVMEDVDFAFSKEVDSLELETSITKGSIQARAIDLVSRTADISEIMVSESELAIKGAGVFTEIDLDLEDLRWDEKNAGVRLRKIAFEMDNGFILERLRGELDSRQDETRLELEIRTGYSQIGIEATAYEAWGEILSTPGKTDGAYLELEQSRISLEDIRCFAPVIETWPAYRGLAAQTVNVGGSLTFEDSDLNISGLSLSQGKNFNIIINGAIQDILKFPEAAGDLDIGISGLDQDWLEEFVAYMGMSGKIPELSELRLEASFSDSLMSPDVNLSLLSRWGSVDVGGQLDFARELFTLAFSADKLVLGEFTDVTDLGSFTGAGEIKGRGFSGGELQASYYLQVDTFEYKAYPYGNTQLTGTIEPGVYGLQLVANDPSFKGDLQLGLQLADSAYAAQATGIFRAQLNDLNLYGDTLGIQTSIDAHLRKGGNRVESELRCGDLNLHTPQRTVVVQELNAQLRTDSVQSTVHADADFFNADLHLIKPMDELDSLGKGYLHYFTSFSNASHITDINRVSVLPAITASATVAHHELLDIFLGDSGLHFSGLEASIEKQADHNSLRATISGNGFTYKVLESETIAAIVTDSAGIISLELEADSTSILSGPDRRITMQANTSERNILAQLRVKDYLDQVLYGIEVEGRADSSQIVLSVPDQEFILNGQDWQLADPEVLSIDLADNMILPSLLMQQDTSYLQMDAKLEAGRVSYALDLYRVDLKSLINTDVFQGNPDVVLSGRLVYGSGSDTEKKISTDLWIDRLGFFGQKFRGISLEGGFQRGASDSYEIEMHAQMDSLEIQFEGERDERGARKLNGTFTHLPVVLVQPFSGDYASELGGSLSGDLNVTSINGNERISGQLDFHKVSAKVNLLNTVFRIHDQSIELADQRALFNEFTILDTLNRPLKMDGFIEFRRQKTPVADLTISSSDMQVMSRNTRSITPFTGNIFVDSRIRLQGPITRPSIGGNIHLTEGTEVFYNHMEDLKMTETQKIVNFVSHAPPDEDIPVPALSGRGRPASSSIGAVIEIDPATSINFNLAKRMFNIYLEVKGGGNIQYNLDNEQMAVSGRYEIGEGTTLLKLVGWPDKTFRLAEGGYIRWSGMVENPELNIEAENKVSTSYLNPIDGKNRDIDFFVMLRLTGFLEELEVLFTIRTPDQYVMSIINTLSPEEQMRQAISVLLFEVIDLPGISSSTDYMTQQVNQILSSQLNQLTQSAIKGVDISFGLDTYDQSAQDGSSETTTSLTYEVSKTFLNNRAQIEFSGRLKDASQETAASDHSLNNLSFEYTLDSAASKYLRVYNEHTYDDVFEGEVIKTGVGFKYKKRYRSLKDIWRRKR